MRRLLATASLCVLATAGLAACGSDGSDAASGKDTATSTTEGSAESKGSAAVDEFCDKVTAQLDKINDASSAASSAEDGLKAMADLMAESVEVAKGTVGDPDAAEQLKACTQQLQDVSNSGS